ncbi:aldo/keto reductase [Streptomyces sp. GbtcB6]|uniref:aldo/keto reductase n=1 Tax=Streptomyces sp. GbtcB6 TaxID=2824751 RepID=UPI001C30E9F1|nr:aldo/keto reductase [Streptomyces sp. GbtcB6]
MGTATFGVSPAEDDTRRVVDFALDQGINFIDTANSYGNQPRFDRRGAPPAEERASAEELVGRAIAGKRDQVVLATKVSEPIGPGPNDGSFAGGGLSRAHITRLVERSLRRLDTDYIDIYYAHHPDPDTDVADTIGTFEDLIRAGKICYYALSTYSGWQLTEAVLTADRLGARRPVCHQVLYSLAKRGVEAEVMPAGRSLGVSTTAFSPLAGGLLAGGAGVRAVAGQARWGGRGFTAEELAFAARFEELAEQWEIAPPALAVAWLLSRDGLASAIVGPESADELVPLLGAVAVRLDPEQLKALDALVPAPRGPWD